MKKPATIIAITFTLLVFTAVSCKKKYGLDDARHGKRSLSGIAAINGYTMHYYPGANSQLHIYLSNGDTIHKTLKQPADVAAALAMLSKINVVFNLDEQCLTISEKPGNTPTQHTKSDSLIVKH